MDCLLGSVPIPADLSRAITPVGAGSSSRRALLAHLHSFVAAILVFSPDHFGQALRSALILAASLCEAHPCCANRLTAPPTGRWLQCSAFVRLDAFVARQRDVGWALLCTPKTGAHRVVALPLFLHRFGSDFCAMTFWISASKRICCSSFAVRSVPCCANRAGCAAHRAMGTLDLSRR